MGRLRLEEFANAATAIRNFERAIAAKQADGFEPYDLATEGAADTTKPTRAAGTASKKRSKTDRGERVASALREDLAKATGIVDRFIARVRASGTKDEDLLRFSWTVEDASVFLDFTLEYRTRGEDEPVHVCLQVELKDLPATDFDAEPISTDINGLAEGLAEADIYLVAKDKVPLGVDIHVEEV